MKKLLHIFLSFLIVYFTTYSAYANTSVGGWSLTDSLIAGGKTTINATKTAGGIALESSVNVASSASKVGAKLIRGGGQFALAYAMLELLEEGVDWILDPANNAVRYKVATDADLLPDGYVWATNHICSTAASTPKASCDLRNAMGNNVYTFHGTGTATGNTCGVQPVTIKKCGDSYPIDPPQDEYNYIPIDTVAAQVISNAEAGHGPSQDVVEAVALEGFAAGELDPALNAAANVVGSNAGTDNPADTDNPAEPVDPTAPTEPAEPIDYTSILSAIKALLVGVLGATSDFFDWGKQQWAEFATTFGALNDWVFEEDSPTDSDNTIDPSIPPVAPVSVAIDFVGGCPAPLGFEFNFYGQNFKPAIPFTPICEVAILINPIIHICATIAAAYIVAGIRQGGT